MDKKFVESIANILDLPENFGYDIDDSSMDICWDIQARLREAGYICNCYAGCSKMAIAFDGLNEVLKIPFNGHWTTNYDYDKSKNCYNYTNMWKYYSNIDYCASEEEEFSIISMYGVGCFFAETKYVGYFLGKNFYSQELVIPAEDTTGNEWTPSADSTNKADQNKYRCSFPLQWLALAYEHYGEDMVNKFFEFGKTDAGYVALSDMHEGNFGYRPDGSPVILDYTGFHR